MAMAWATGVDPVWLGKKEMFAGPAGWLFKKMGGVPVDRKNPAGLVDAMDAMRVFYADKHGMRPGRFTPPLLREETAVSGPV